MKYRLLKPRFDHPAGIIVHQYDKFDYGLRGDDEFYTGKPHTNVSLAKDEEPFFTVPTEDLEPLP